MRAGRLRDRLTLQAYVETKDAIGGTVQEWQDVRKVWAEVRGVSGRNFMSASAEQAEITSEILMRYRPGIEAGMRLVRGTDVYTIVAPLPDAKRTELRCMCTRGVKK